MKKKEDILELEEEYEDILKLEKKYTVEYDNKIIVLKKIGNLRPGKNELKDIKWYVYSIPGNLELFDNKYDKVAFMFSKVNADILKRLIPMKEGISKFPWENADANTGNIHPPKEDYKKIRQLVLFKGSGPLTLQFMETDEYYIYSAVHKACYYPLINEDDNEENMKKLKDDNRYKFLEAVWKALPPEIKEEN